MVAYFIEQYDLYCIPSFLILLQVGGRRGRVSGIVSLALRTSRSKMTSTSGHQSKFNQQIYSLGDIPYLINWSSACRTSFLTIEAVSDISIPSLVISI